MAHRMWKSGHVVIPKQLRDELGLTPGVEVDIFAEGGRVVIAPHQGPRSAAGASDDPAEDRAAG